jgi:hypothetical protein
VAIDQTQVMNELLEVLDETFEHHHGIFLDAGTSLLATLRGIDHRQASIPVGGRCATLAAQVAHVTFYLEVLERDIVAEDETKADWGEIWRTVGSVTAEEWDGLRANLERTYRRVVAELRAVERWEPDRHLAGALAIAVHTAYHLGEIRQALCIIGSDTRGV